MNGFRPFGVEASAWQSGYEAGVRFANHGGGKNTAADEMTAEEGILHIQKIVQQYTDQHNEMGVVEQMRHEGDLWSACMDEIRYILTQVSDR